MACWGLLLGGGSGVTTPNRGASLGADERSDMSKRTLAVLAIGAGLLAVHLLTGGADASGDTIQAGAPPATTIARAAPAPAATRPPAVPASEAPSAPAAPAAPASAATEPAPAASATPAAAPATNRKAAAAAPEAAAAAAEQVVAPATIAAARPVAPVVAAPPTTAPAVLEYGSTHPWVTLSQRRLNTLGYGVLDVDGRFGPATQAAVVRFEQAHGTTVDGRLDTAERLLLLSNQAQAFEDEPIAPAVTQPVAAPPAPPQPTVKLTLPAGLATADTARTNANCQAIEAEFLRQGAEAAVADQFAYVIAPRESGCVAQQVSTTTDHSYSRLGLNFIGNMPTYWNALCGVSDYLATAELSVDVRCGLAAYRALGWKPWGG